MVFMKQSLILATECGFGWSLIMRLSLRIPHSVLKLLPLPPRWHGIDIGCAGVLFRPDSFELTLDDLDRQRFVEVLVLVSFPVLELDRPVGGLEVRGLERIADCVGRPGLCPTQGVCRHKQRG